MIMPEQFLQQYGVEKDLDKAAGCIRKALEAGYEPDEDDQKHLKALLGEDYTTEK